MYHRSIDGLRAIAVWLVLLFHLGVPWFYAGWIGVQIFFVISGFLITSILVESSENSSTLKGYLIKFYWRRGLRIFPLYYLYLLINFLIMLAFSRPVDNYGFYLAYLQNYLFGLSKFQETQGFLAHTWSLAVEEQFYLVWPLVIYFTGRRGLFYISSGMIAVGFLSRRFILSTFDGNPYLFFTALPSCLDALGFGVLLYAIFSDGSRWFKKQLIPLVGLLASVLVFACMVDINEIAFLASPSSWVPRYGSSLILVFSVFSFFLVWLALTLSILVRSLSIPPLIYTGRISYGLYIYHGLCFSVVGLFGLDRVMSGVLGLLFAYIVSHYSYLLFESKFLELKDKYS